MNDIVRITPEQFFAWVSGKEERYELVDGEVVMWPGPVVGMTVSS
jgi:hypothetical protein